MEELNKCFCKANIDPVVYMFTIFFGVGSWITINGLWVELPSIVPFVPEGWTLPSYLSVIAQIANIGPIAVTVTHALAPGKLKDVGVAYAIIAISAVSCILLSFTWSTTGIIGGTEHSVALLILVFFTSLADCTSSVVFIPFMSIFKTEYMTALYIGEGMSGLLPGFVALGQGVSESHCQNVTKFNETSNSTYYAVEEVYEGLNFPVRDFFIFLSGMMILSGFGFTMLNFLPRCKKEQVIYREKAVSDVSIPYVDMSNSGSVMSSTDISTDSVLSNDEHINSDHLKSFHSSMTENQDSSPHMSADVKVYLFVIICVLSFFGNGILSSISTYSSLPYGEKAYHLSTTLSNIANPIACMIAFVVSVRSSQLISVLWLMWMIACGYTLYLAAASPFPILVGTTAGSFLMVMTSVALSFLMSYIKVCIAILFREQGKSSLVWLGGVTQLGSFLGSVIGYILVNVASVFSAANSSCLENFS